MEIESEEHRPKFRVSGGVTVDSPAFLSYDKNMWGGNSFGFTFLFFVFLVVRSTEAAETLPIFFPSGHHIQAEVADTKAKKKVGLMFRESLAPNAGMLFVYSQAGVYSFWMKNCRFPIDIIWLDPKKTVVQITERVPPCLDDPCPVYNPHVEALYVIEVNAGLSQREGLTVGSKIRF